MIIKNRLLTEVEKFKIRDYLSWRKLTPIETIARALKIPGHLISLYLNDQSRLVETLGSKTEPYYFEQELLEGYKEPSFKDLKVGERRFYRSQPKILKKYKFNEEGD